MRSLRSLPLHVAAVAAFAVMSVAWTWPLARELSTSIPGHPGDNVAFLWNDWWMRQALSAGTSPFASSSLFAPFGIDLTLHTHTALTSWVAATLLAAWPIVLAHNVVLLAVLTLNGVSAYALAWDRLGKPPGSVATESRWWGAMLAGVIFAGSPYIAAHLSGHMNLVSAWGLPLFTLLFLRMLERRSFPAAAGAAAVTALTAFNDYYYAVYIGALAVALVAHSVARVEWISTTPRRWLRRVVAVVLIVDVALVAAVIGSGGFTATVLGVRIAANRPTNLLAFGWLLALILFLQHGHPRLVRRARTGNGLPWARLATTATLVVAGTAPIWLRAIALLQRGEFTSPRVSWRSGPAGVDLLTLGLGHPWHGWFGAPVRRVYDALGINAVESIGWTGVVALGLAAAALWRWRRDAEVVVWRWLAFAFFVWALGPWLKIGGFDTGLLLPQNVLAHIPVLSNARMPGRAMVVVFMALSVLAAIALARWRSRVRPAAITVIAVALLELLPAPVPLTRLETPALYTTLRDLPPGAVCELPVGVRDGFGMKGHLDDRVLGYQMTHAHPLVGGFAARVPVAILQGYERLPVVRSLFLLSEGLPANPDDVGAGVARTRQHLQDAGIRYVVLDRASASPPLVAYVERELPLRSIERDGDRELLVVVE